MLEIVAKTKENLESDFNILVIGNDLIICSLPSHQGIASSAKGEK